MDGPGTALTFYRRHSFIYNTSGRGICHRILLLLQHNYSTLLHDTRRNSDRRTFLAANVATPVRMAIATLHTYAEIVQKVKYGFYYNNFAMVGNFMVLFIVGYAYR